MNKMIDRLENNIRIAHLQCQSEVAYLGVAINVGSSDEQPEEYGLSHFIEHMLFKGTKKRSNYRLISCLEDVGGEMNAYTTKEETFIYSAFPKQYMKRAMALLSDILFNSTFPESEMEKEKDVVLDEINSYKDNPAEVIFDEFEEMVFEGHPLAHNILGTEETVKSFTQQMIFDFIEKNYSTDKMVVFSLGDFSETNILKLATKYFSNTRFKTSSVQNSLDVDYTVKMKQVDEGTYQAHSMLGGIAYPLIDERRSALRLLCNMLGGPAMNARLNYQLRERNGIGYNIETNYSAYRNSGIVYIYWGSDENNIKKSTNIIIRELNKLIDNDIKESTLKRVKQQYLGQLMLAYEQNEVRFLNFGKSVLRFNSYKSVGEVIESVNAITAEEIKNIAREVFCPKHLSSLIFI